MKKFWPSALAMILGLAVLGGIFLLGGCIHATIPQPVPTPVPTPSPSPVPVPPPTPTPEPIPASCPLQLPLAGYGLGLRIGPHGDAPQQKDATPFVKRGNDPTVPWPPLGWTGACRPNQCDLGAEKDPEHGDICTRTLCGPSIIYSLEPPESGIINWVDGYTVKVTMSAPGRLLGACSANPSVRTSIAVP